MIRTGIVGVPYIAVATILVCDVLLNRGSVNLVTAFHQLAPKTTRPHAISVSTYLGEVSEHWSGILDRRSNGQRKRGVSAGLPLPLLFAIRSLDHVAESATDGDDNSGDDESLMTSSPSTSAAPGDKLRRLKDMMWVRECLEDLTAAEFACTVEAVGADDDEDDNAKTRPKRRRKRAVDYEKLLTQLNKRIRDLGCENVMSSTSYDEQLANDFQCILESGTGMGSLTYTDSQRAGLLERLVRTRIQLIHVIHGNKIDVAGETIPFLQNLQIPELPRMELPKEEVEDALSPKLYVRDDGTVDWDGALTSGAALRQFGTAVWARINGRDSDSVHSSEASSLDGAQPNHSDSHTPPSKAVTAKIIETPGIVEARNQLRELSNKLIEMEKDHYKLLNSAISQGQTTANVKLAMLNAQLRSQIQSSALAVDNMKVRVSFQTLVYEMERIYTYLLGELGNPALNGYIPLQDRLNVAEFGLLESQVDSFNRQFMDNESVDEDVLAVVFEQLTDFKRRLGIDYYVAGLSFDREAIGRWLVDLWGTTKTGLTFYAKGVRLFWNDIIFCLKLINRAAQGYTLKPREVRTIRRTFKDILTFIPFVIILLIPLSPIGHVLVFGAIQRFFPDFFPSCFTEQRQNLLQLYETAEYSELVINETWNAKLARFSEAIIYLATNTLRTLYYKLLGFRRPESSDDDNEFPTAKKQ